APRPASAPRSSRPRPPATARTPAPRATATEAAPAERWRAPRPSAAAAQASARLRTRTPAGRSAHPTGRMLASERADLRDIARHGRRGQPPLALEIGPEALEQHLDRVGPRDDALRWHAPVKRRCPTSRASARGERGP